MGIGGALGAIGGGVLGIVGKLAGAGGIGLKTLVTGNALSGAITSMADDICILSVITSLLCFLIKSIKV
jgi:hypothetical protein